MNKVVKVTTLREWGIILSFLFLLPGSARAQSYEEAVQFRNRGLERQRAGDFEGAFNFYQKALLLRPDLSIVHNDVGTLCETQGWLEEAQRAYQQALSLTPPYRLAEYNLALLYEKQGDVPKAMDHLEHFIFTSGDDRWIPRAQTSLEALRERVRRREEGRRREEERIRQARDEKRQRHRWEDSRKARKKKVAAAHSALQRQRHQKAQEKRTRLKEARRREEERIRQAKLSAQQRGKEAALKTRERESQEVLDAVKLKEQQEEALQKERQKQWARLFEKGKNAYRREQYEEALEIFEALLKQDPGNPDVEDYYELTRPFIKRRTRYSGFSAR